MFQIFVSAAMTWMRYTQAPLKREKTCSILHNLTWTLFSMMFMVLPVRAQQDLSPTKLFEKVRASVVVVKSRNAKGQDISQGSGVKLPSGRIVTNFHVVKDGKIFLVGRGKTFVAATIYASDAEKDICLLNAPDLKAPGIVVGRASALKVGATVYAVGSPKGLELSFSNGLVSQLRGGNPPMIQTTAPISPGSSGGGLFDNQGRLVGITSFYIDGGQSLNFALPVEWIDLVKPGSPKVNVLHATGEWQAMALQLEDEEKWEDLVSWCQHWLKVEPNNSSPWFSLGHGYMQSGQNSEAIEPFKQAVKLYPEDGVALSDLGIVYAKLKRNSEALEAFRQSVRVYPEYAKGWNNLGNVYSVLNRYPEAIDAFQQSQRIDPEYAAAWYNLGSAYTDLKRFPEAIEAYRQAIKIRSDDPDYWYGLGNVYYDLNRYSDASQAYSQAVRINPEFKYAWYNMGMTYHLSGNQTAALDAMKHLRSLDPGMSNKLFDNIVPK